MLLPSEVTAAASSAGYGQAPDLRQLYDFGDRIALLRPQETPLFVYSSRLRKFPVSSQIFRYLEDRVPTQSFERTFLIANTPYTAPGTVTANTQYNFSVDTGSDSVDWLIQGHVFIVRTVDDSGDAGYSQIPVRIDTAPVDQGTSTTFTGRVLDLSETTPSGYNSIANNDECRVIGTAFQPGSGAPDVWSEEIEEGFGYTQIFKTAAELAKTTMATEYRGYKDEWARIWNLKLREHKAMIEAGMLFSQRAYRDSMGFMTGIVGDIIKNTTLQLTGTTDLSYTSGQYFGRSVAVGELNYDLILRDFEVLMDPVRGSAQDKLVLVSPQVNTRFNRLAASSGFIPNSNVTQNVEAFYRPSEGAFGNKVLVVETVYGDAHLVLEPQFRGPNDRFMVFVDMDHVAYRPLVGNGLNRDTFIESNIQVGGEDSRKDQILTEAGFEVTMPEMHMLYHLEDN
jgi:hypothetical protein